MTDKQPPLSSDAQEDSSIPSEELTQALQAFQDWFFSPAGPGVGRIPLHEPVHHKDGITAITLYRRKGYQAEFLILPPDREYEIETPATMPFTMVFLGGAFTYGECLLVGAANSSNGQRGMSADDYRAAGLPALSRSPDPLDHIHPLREKMKTPPFVCLPGSPRSTFRATGEEGIIMLFSRQETDRPRSLLEHVKSLQGPFMTSKESSGVQ